MTDLRKLIAGRIRKCRKDSGLTLTQAAQQLSAISGEAVSLPRFSNWETTIEPKIPSLHLFPYLAKIFNVSAAYLAGFEDVPRRDFADSDYVTSVRTIALHGQRLEVEGADDSLAFRRAFAEELGVPVEKLLVIKQIDDSMRDTLGRGDRAVIDTRQTRVKGKDLFGLLVNGDVWLRWIRPEVNGAYTIAADDSDQYPDQQLTAEELADFQIIGRVVSLNLRR
jgi:transcriptional regulator with XRE-family HTH domain